MRHQFATPVKGRTCPDNQSEQTLSHPFAEQADRNTVHPLHCLQQHSDLCNPNNVLEDVLNAFSIKLEQHPNDPEWLACSARVYLKMGRYDRAEKYAQKALIQEKPPTRLAKQQAYFVLGYLAYKQSNLQAGLSAFKQANLGGGFSCSRIHYLLSSTYHQLADDQSLPASGLKRFGYRVKSGFHQAMAYLALPFDADRIPLSQLLLVVPTLCNIQWMQKSETTYQPVLDALLEAHQRFPGLPTFMLMIGAMFQQLGEWDQAGYWYQKAVNRDPVHEDGLQRLAGVYEEQQDYALSVQTYQRLAALRPGDAYIWCQLGNAYYLNGEPEKTIECFKKGLMLPGDNIWKSYVAISLANLYREMGQSLDLVQATLQQAVFLNPTEVEHYTQLGLVSFENNQPEMAHTLYEQALRLAPDDHKLYSNLGYLKWMRGEIDPAIALYQQAIRLCPDYEIAYNNLAVIYLDHLGRVVEATELLEQATALNEHYALAFYNLGRAYSLLDKKIEAAQYFQQAQCLNEMTHELDGSDLDERLANLFRPAGQDYLSETDNRY